jgi:hypothetical protein
MVYDAFVDVCFAKCFKVGKGARRELSVTNGTLVLFGKLRRRRQGALPRR